MVLASGRGLFLSAKDHALLERWAARGARLEDTCRALVAAFARFREANGSTARWPRTLKYFEREVLEAIRVSVTRDPAPSSPPPAEAPRRVTLLDELTWIGSSQTDPRLRAAWQEASSRPEATDETLDRDTALAAVDAALTDAFLARLDDGERDELSRCVEGRLRPERASLGVRGLTHRRRAIMRAELASRYGLLELSQMMDP